MINDEQWSEIRRLCRLHGVDADTADAMVFAVGYQAGRNQAAADIRATILAGSWPPFLGVGAKPRARDLAEWAARIAEGGGA